MNKTSHGGKGDAPRPQSISAKEMADNWDRIFGGVKKWTVTYTLDGVPHKNVYSTCSCLAVCSIFSAGTITPRSITS